MGQELKLLSERQEMLKGMVEDKMRLQSRATEKCYEHFLVEMKELEEEKSEEALVLVQKKTICGDTRLKEMKHDGCKDLEVREG